MPTDPDNTRYPAPFSTGEDGWGDDMSSNLDQLAVDVPDSGPIADRPSPSAEFAPDYYYATDEQRQYFNTGTSWRAMDARVRLLSTFGSVQSAVDWSKNNGTPAATVIVDGEYTTDEGTVTLPNRTILRGLGQMNSRIVTTATTTNPLFEYQDGVNTIPLFSDITFKNEGSGTRPFFKCAVSPSAFSGFLGTQMRWDNIFIHDFGGVYPLDLANLWGGSLSNIYLNSKAGSPTGFLRMTNCNACNIDTLRAVHCNSGDGETPVIYADGCTGTHFAAPHVENIATDAAIQFAGSGSMISMSGLHLEPHDFDINAGIQIGDGGLTAGNTNGSTGTPHVYVLGGVIHGNNSTSMEGVRLLGGETSLIGLRIFDPTNGIDQYLHYGGSNHDTVSTSPERAVIMGARDVTVTNNSGGAAHVLNLGGKTYADETTAASNLNLGEIAFVENSTGDHSLVKQDSAGVNHVWDPDRTI